MPSKLVRILLDVLLVVAFVAWFVFAFFVLNKTLLCVSIVLIWIDWGIQKKIGMI